MAEDTQRNHQELCLLYENATANLELLKKSQWQVYVFYSAVVAFLLLLKDNNKIINEQPIKSLISVSLLLGTIAVEFAQAYFRLDMSKYRKILGEIYEKFGYPFREIRERAKGKKKALNPFEKVFKHVGCIYIFIVFTFATVIFWLEELKTIDGLLYVLILMLTVLALLTPLSMDTMVKYIDDKDREGNYQSKKMNNAKEL